MSDITLCANESCTKRSKCYRATAPAGHMQSISQFTQAEDGSCEHYLYEPGTDADEPAKVDW